MRAGLVAGLLLAAGCASNPADVVATGSAKTDLRLVEPNQCADAELFKPQRPDAGWFANKGTAEHPLGNLVAERPIGDEIL